MLDIERELLADTFTTFDLTYSGGRALFAKLYIDTKIPWLADSDGNPKKKRSMVQRMADLYDRHKKGTKKEK